MRQMAMQMEIPRLRDACDEWTRSNVKLESVLRILGNMVRLLREEEEEEEQEKTMRALAATRDAAQIRVEIK